MLPRVFGLYNTKNSALVQTEYKNVLMNWKKGQLHLINIDPSNTLTLVRSPGLANILFED